MNEFVLGIAGDGQLGRMLAQAAQRMGITVRVMGSSSRSPAGQVAPVHIGDIRDARDVEDFGRSVSMLTFEFEDVDADALIGLEDGGMEVHPSGRVLKRIKDKFLQKVFISELGVPTTPFAELTDLAADIEGFMSQHCGPAMIKSRLGSYDGHGNLVITADEDTIRVVHKFGDAKLYIETHINMLRELAVVITRGRDGAIVAYPVVETRQEGGICDSVIGPMPESDLTRQAVRITTQIAEALDYVGTMAVVFFETTDGLLFNEMAPRVHNSGHWTLDADGVTSQFENHIRAVMGWPLGDVADFVAPFAMVNILGAREGEISGPPPGAEKALYQPGVHLHWYGKSQSKEGRKMGHINAVSLERPDTCFTLREHARCARNRLDV